MINFNGFSSINTEEFLEEIKNNTPIIDVRREEEWEYYGIIENSHLITFFDNFGRYDINNWMEQFSKIVPSQDSPFILVCAHANRTKVIGELLGVQLGYQNVLELDGGIVHGWIEKGLKTVLSEEQ
jgi:rhodanese-related sulfurtransferase